MHVPVKVINSDVYRCRVTYHRICHADTKLSRGLYIYRQRSVASLVAEAPDVSRPVVPDPRLEVIRYRLHCVRGIDKLVRDIRSCRVFSRRLYSYNSSRVRGRKLVNFCSVLMYIAVEIRHIYRYCRRVAYYSVRYANAQLGRRVDINRDRRVSSLVAEASCMPRPVVPDPSLEAICNRLHCIRRVDKLVRDVCSCRVFSRRLYSYNSSRVRCRKLVHFCRGRMHVPVKVVNSMFIVVESHTTVSATLTLSLAVGCTYTVSVVSPPWSQKLPMCPALSSLILALK